MVESHRALARGLKLQSADPDGPIRFTASTTRVNRYGFSLRTSGWRLENYNANPVFLFQHIPFMSIGRGDASITSNRLQNDVIFDLDDALGAKMDRQYRSGFMNAVSVGFSFIDRDGNRMGDWRKMTAEDIHSKAFYDLEETSAAVIPADAGAVKQHGSSAVALALAAEELLDIAASDFGAEDEQVQSLLRDPDFAKLLTGQPPSAGGDVEALGRRVDQLTDTVGRLLDLAERGVDLANSRLQMRAMAPHSTATEDSDWDGPAAVSSMPNDAAVLRYCHAWMDAEGDADVKASYKFPHHRTQGGPANLGGCRNGLARVSGSSIPEGDKAGVERHLRSHLDSAQNSSNNSATPQDALMIPQNMQEFLKASFQL